MLQHITDEVEQYERIAGYSDPGEGKTRWATSLTERFGDIIYICADEGSERMDPILHTYRPRVKRLKVRAPDDPKGREGWDPIAEYWDIAIKARDGTWRKEFPNAKTIIIDSVTEMGNQWMQHIANTGQFSVEKHIRIGPRGSEGGYNIPLPGDYGATQNAINRYLAALFELPYHIICVFHAAYDEPDSGGAAEFGPKTVGKATVRTIAGKFPMVVRVASKTIGAGPGKEPRQEVTAYTQRQGLWNAKLRSGDDVNPMPKVVLNPDPINFWEKYDELIYSKAAGSANG
jgi:hypothetical protein